jgi:hypothetical protein
MQIDLKILLEAPIIQVIFGAPTCQIDLTKFLATERLSRQGVLNRTTHSSVGWLVGGFSNMRLPHVCGYGQDACAPRPSLTSETTKVAANQRPSQKRFTSAHDIVGSGEHSGFQGHVGHA